MKFGTKIFLSFLAYLIPFWLKIMPERGFLIFCYFFRNFLAQVENEWNSGLKFFSSFSVYLIPFSLEIMPELGFLIF